MDLIRDRIKETIDGCVFKVARIVLVDKEVTVTEDDDTFVVGLEDMSSTDAVLTALQEFVDVEELTLDELQYAMEACEEACNRMSAVITSLAE